MIKVKIGVTISKLLSILLITVLFLYYAGYSHISFAVTLPATINIDRTNALFAANSYVLGTNRNHVANNFLNAAAKLNKMKELTPTWGQQKYLYRVGHSAIDGRVDYDYMTGYHFEQNWNKSGEYPYDDLRYAVSDANTIGADQIHSINFGTGTAEEAARYVNFLNKSNDANRAAHFMTQQNVQLFEIGTEVSWDMVRGHNQYAPNETAYAIRAKQFAQQMRAASDVPIKIGAVAGTNSNWEGTGWSGGATTVKNILQTMGNDVDFLIFHGYPSWPVDINHNQTTMMAQNEWNRIKIDNEIKPAIQQYGNGRDIRIANTEFFTEWYDNPAQSRGMFGAMYSADSIILALNENLLTAVEFGMDHGDMADQAFWYGDDPNNTTAIFKLQKMIAQHWGESIVRTSGQNIPSLMVQGDSTYINTPRLSFSASIKDNKTYVMVLNRFNDSDVTSNLNLGFTPSNVIAYELSGNNGWNSTTDADVKTIGNPSLNNYNFKHATVTIFEITGAAVTMSSPIPGTKFNASDTINFSGDGKDSLNNVIPASAFNWNVTFVNNGVETSVYTTSGVKSGSYVTPRTGYASTNSYYRIYVSAIDPTNSQLMYFFQDVLPYTSNVTITSNISGLPLALDSSQIISPYVFKGIVGTQKTISAGVNNNMNGVNYSFQKWSDNDSRPTRDIYTPPTDGVWSALYNVTSWVTGENVNMATFNGKIYQAMRGTDSFSYTRYSSDGINWSPWQQSGQTLTEVNLAVFNNRLYQSIKGTDGNSYDRYTTDGVNWTTFARGGATLSSVALASANGILFEAILGTDGNIYTRQTSNGDNWTVFQRSGASTTGVTMMPFAGRLYQAMRGSDGNSYSRWTVDGSNWSVFERGGLTTGKVNMTVLNGNKLFQAIRGTDGYSYSRYTIDGDNWTIFSSGGFLLNNVSLGILGNKIFQSIRGADGNVYTRYSTDGNNWTPFAVGGGTISDINMGNIGSRLVQSMQGTDRNYYTRSSTDGNNWSGWAR